MPEVATQPKVYSRTEHAICNKQISKEALKVLHTLDKAGFRACLVGGGVRDLLLGIAPKDFDVGTDARPAQIRSLFRNVRLVGRRFRLAHVRFGSEIVEVATFRKQHDMSSTRQGRIVRDNVFGTLQEDVWRRDLTVNALYYDIRDCSVIDYVSGLEDLKSKKLRVIGEPLLRYQEDPVRMLRVIRFAAKLGFSIAPSTQKAIGTEAHRLREISPARLFDEILKIFLGGQALASFEFLERFGLFKELFPLTSRIVSEREGEGPYSLVKNVLRNTDLRLQKGKSVSPGFLLAAILWETFDRTRIDLIDKGLKEADAYIIAEDEVVSEQCKSIAMPRRVSRMVRDTWFLQKLLERPTRKRAARIVRNPRFRAAYDLLVLRSASGERTRRFVNWWERYLRESANNK
jgi:poly(A) polymerase